MCATAAPARAASIAASAICSGVTGTCSLRATVSPAPVTAQVTKTSQFTASSVRYANWRCTSCEARSIIRRFPMVQSAPTRPLDLDALRAAARAFARDEMRPVALAYDESEEYPLEVLRRAAALGLTCYDLPADYGGGGVGRLRDRWEVVEELAWGDSPIFWVIAQGGFFAAPLLALGSDQQRQRWLAPLCPPEPPACSVAITEPEHGSDSAAIETTAVRRGGGYVLNGRKKFIGNGDVADLCIVFATVDPGSRSRGITAFVVEAADEGFVRGPRLPKMGSRCFPPAGGAVGDCFVPEDRRLGAEGEGFRGLMWVFDVARVQLAAGSVGLGRAALELAVEYAKEREALGRPIHEFQAVSFRLADAKLKLDQARLMTHRAANLADAGQPFSTEAAMAKLAASEAAVFATSAAVMTLGGAGYIRDSLAQKWYRDAKLDEIWDGTSDIMRLLIARSLFT